MEKKIILFVSALCLSAVFVFGQNQSTNWQTYTSPKGEFSVEMPNKVDETLDISKDFKNENNEVYKYGNFKTKSQEISYFVFTEAIQERNPNNFSRFPGENLKLFFDENQHEKKSIKLGDFDGEYYTLVDSGNFFHTIILVKTQSRSYIFHTISQNNNIEESDRFFNSIKLNKINNISPKIIVVKKPDLPAFPDDSTKPYGVRSPSSAINIEGFNIGSQAPGGISSVPIPMPRQAIEQDLSRKSPLKIHSIIKPPYTNLARIYGIIGVVRLRVVFKSDGTIGDVSIISGLPLGLTTNALIAAKQLHFAPAKTNDIPQTITKVIEYHFSLF